jgi:hypothetical protein
MSLQLAASVELADFVRKYDVRTALVIYGEVWVLDKVLSNECALISAELVLDLRLPERAQILYPYGRV